MLESIFNTSRKCIYIAEIGLNHNGNMDTAFKMIDAAAEAGADAVKFQAFTPEKMNSVYTNSLLKTGTEDQADNGIVEFFKSLYFGIEEYRALKKRAEDCGMVFFASVFDLASLEIMESLGAGIYKIASSEVTNHSLIKAIAETGKPVICSTGISLESEIGAAVNIFREKNIEPVLMHCVSLYPPAPEELNLQRIISLKERFATEVGYSDHNRDALSCALAAACGARIFEKHFTYADEFDCPDRAVSLSPDMFSEMIVLCETAAAMKGNGVIDYGEAEKSTALAARRSLFASRFIPAGKKIEDDDMISLRPGVGLPDYKREMISGKTVKIDIEKNYLLREEYFED